MIGLKFSRWQWTTIATLTVGYAGYYICRSNFSVATPLLLEAFGEQGLDKAAIGKIAAIGTLLYSWGKIVNGVLCDFVGGRRMFLFGMFASICATILFGIGSGFTVFMVAWALNRAVQSMGWGALVKTASNWFEPKAVGTVMGILALSYYFGDVFARAYLGQLINLGVGWRGLFFAAAATLFAIFLFGWFFLKPSPSDVGEPEPDVSASNLFGAGGNEKSPRDLLDLLIPFFKSPGFWMVCFMSLGLTIIRETFGLWTPLYLTEVAAMSNEGAAGSSALFPLFGGISVILAGYISDRLSLGRRGIVMFAFLAPSLPAMYFLSQNDSFESHWPALILISLTGLSILGPYAFLSGVLSVDLGGKKGSSTAAGLADAVGYFGAAIVGNYGVGEIAERYGWGAAFGLMAVIAAATMVVTLAYWYLHEVRGALRIAVTAPPGNDH